MNLKLTADCWQRHLDLLYAVFLKSSFIVPWSVLITATLTTANVFRWNSVYFKLPPKKQTENKYCTLFNRYINTNTVIKTSRVSANNSEELRQNTESQRLQHKWGQAQANCNRGVMDTANDAGWRGATVRVSGIRTLPTTPLKCTLILIPTMRPSWTVTGSVIWSVSNWERHANTHDPRCGRSSQQCMHIDIKKTFW